MTAPSSQSFKRKPVASDSGPSPSFDVSDILDDYFYDQDEEDSLAEKARALTLETRPSMPPRPNTIPLIPSVSEPAPITHTSTTIPEVPSASKSFWQTAFDETIHFAGGLVSHPFEATKHYSILRHSSGLVYYKGPSTRVTITVFSDVPMPSDRSFWLQRKGFSGDMGMSVSVLLGTSSNWIDVTPTSEALPSEMPESDERAWQRDMKKFLKKASKHKSLSKHVARETCVVRIPAVASDGYLRVVMCTGEGRKKVLCPSPIFRIASTSSDVSIFRGASLSTMPLEAGLKVASIVGTTVVNKYVGPAKAIVDNRVQKYTNKYKPGFIAERAEQIAFAKSGVRSKFESLEANFDGARDVSYDPLHPPCLIDSPPEVVGSDVGPEKPFPLKVVGMVVHGTGQSKARFGLPTANLAGVSNDLMLRLNGIYMGWASVYPKKGVENISNNWYEAIITIGPSPYASPQVVIKKVATVHVLRDFGDTTFFDAKMKVILMAYLRPIPASDRSQPALKARDVDVALASLSRDAWSPDVTVEKMKDEKSARSVADRYVEVRTQVQKHVDSLPVHLAGVRTASAEVIDKAHGRGGLFIRR
ncbi:hypothetical protein JX265_000321 [Neoarthrinium moseri]|uniref:Riboflavin kinase n=1 Tax=Neoarthrinium moseri TaxID=1658444 RepID=A0A9P9WY98_9PEZI|nr:uncharacterized protein JN550_000571 [Neoarthrinium moseri]KAI1878389.1 hypothetical protein JN550_000571 [Neoarthrinium moseri]KAI1881495.1 hypothetical protein JX265_000321 [Neoarthrinium moseri]